MWLFSRPRRQSRPGLALRTRTHPEELRCKSAAQRELPRFIRRGLRTAADFAKAPRRRQIEAGGFQTSLKNGAKEALSRDQGSDRRSGRRKGRWSLWTASVQKKAVRAGGLGRPSDISKASSAEHPPSMGSRRSLRARISVPRACAKPRQSAY
jgi:hypothetical protein